MPTVVVSHSQALAAYLVAASLRLYFPSRNFKIIVVESLDTNLTSQPYCGISTVSNQRLVHGEFFKNAFFRGVLQSALSFLGSIQIHSLGRTEHPDFPQNQHGIRATIGLPDQHIALLYHPQILLHRLRQSLLADPLVTFLSVPNRNAVSQVRADLYITFAPGEGNNKMDNLDLTAHSCLCPVEGLSAPVLWLPLFKATTQMFEAIFTNTLSSSVLEIHTVNLNNNEICFASRYDLNHGIKACDYVLLIMDGLAARLGLVPSML